MKTSLIAIAFAVASMPMFAQTAPSTPTQNPPAKTKKASKKGHKKAPKKDAGSTTPQK